ncbi:MAG: hypothetical protein Q8P89_03690 [bacterium]|nr:hypothetical protein [bacterium]
MIGGKENPVQWKDPTAEEAMQRILREKLKQPVSKGPTSLSTTTVNPANESPFEELESGTIFEIERRIYYLKKSRRTGMNQVDYRDRVNFYRRLLVKVKRG